MTTDRSKNRNKPKKEPIFNDAGKEICGAIGKRSGKPCQSTMLMAGRRCRMHGGATPSGPLAGQYKTGKYSKLLPKSLRGSYEEAESDPKLLELRSEIALADTRRQELMGQLSSGSYDSLHKQLDALYSKAQQVISTGDVKGLRFVMAEWEKLITETQSSTVVWREIMEVEEHKRKLVESEHKRLTNMGMVYTAAEAILLLNRIAYAIKETVTDRDTLKKLSRELEKIQGDIK